MKYIIKAHSRYDWAVAIIGYFVTPFFVMICWGAFVHMTDFGLPTITYWQAFMLNIVAMIFRGKIPLEWIVREDK